MLYLQQQETSAVSIPVDFIWRKTHGLWQIYIMDESAAVAIARAWKDSEAIVIVSLLHSYGIPSHYSSELPHRIYPVSTVDQGGIKVFVPAAFAEEAYKILQEHRRHTDQLHLVEDDKNEEHRS